MQQRLWFLDQLEPENSVYNLAWALRLHGKPDITALERAISAVVDRHEALRTTFVGHDGAPMQMIADELFIPVNLESVIERSGLDDRLVVLARQPFDLSSGPLLRVNLLTAPDHQGDCDPQGGNDHVLLLVIHHIIADGWSMSVLFRELGEAYNAYRRDEMPSLPILPVQYADYALWQREWLSGPELERQLDYWRAQLDGAPPLLRLPADRARPVTPSYRGARLSRTIPATLSAELHALGRREDCTFFMVLLAAFDVVLARFSGQEDVVVGTPIAGRGRTELEGLIGFFVNTLALRVDLSGNPAFREILARIKRTALEAYAHQDLPFEKLVDELNPNRATNCTPIFQVLLNLHNEPGLPLKLDGLDVTPFGVDRGTSKFDLSVALTESDHGLFAVYEYNSDLFDADTIRALVDCYESVLGQVAAAPGLRIGDLTLPVEAQPAVALPDCPRQLPGASLVSQFRAQVVRDPKHLAVHTLDGGWSYGELNSRANRVAHSLLPLIGPGPQRVGLMCDHNAQLLAGLLGILKAGSAYVALDPELPAARLKQRIADAGIAAVVADTGYLDMARSLVGDDMPVVSVAPVDNLGGDAAGASPDSYIDPDISVGPEMPAYVLYTSGTTGEPKGVLQTHGGVVQNIAAYSGSLQLDADDRLSWLSGFGFDAAIQDIFGALLNGAVVCPLDVRVANGGELVAELVAAGVTVLHATPTVYRHMLGGELNCAHDLSAVRRIVLGGEAVRRSDFELFRARFVPGTVFVNGLGLTEATVALQFHADHDTRLPGDVVPVGRAVAGVEVALLTSDGTPSWCGEIVLRGHGVARCYWQRDALTRQRFSMADGVPAYRTGDLGRRLPDGQIAWVGRVDDQVKVRGYRVEPGEIEGVLSDHALVDECVVTVDRLPGGDARLVAYVVATDGTAATQTELHAHLVDGLPGYMLPQAIELLPEFVRLANGKVDRSRLPAPQWGRDMQQALVPARTELEAVLTEIWRDVLQVDVVGVHDDFFALGGHSLLATRLVSRIRDRLALEVPLLSVFECPTVAGLADTLEHGVVSKLDVFPRIGYRDRDPDRGNARI